MKLYITLFLICNTYFLIAQNYKWVKTFGSASDEFGYSVKTDQEGNVYCTGSFSEFIDMDPGPGTSIISSVGGVDIFIIKYDSSGNLIWAKSLGGKQADEGFALVLDQSGNIYITGYFQKKVDFNPDSGTSMMTAQGSKDLFVLKLNNDGVFLWAKDVGGTGTTIGKALCVSNSGDVALTGYFKGSTDFDPEATTYSLMSMSESNDAFILQLSPDGHFLWAHSISSSGFEEGWSIQADKMNNVYAVGFFENTVDFDPDIMLENNKISNGGKDIYLIKYSSGGIFQFVKTLGGSLDDVCKSLALGGSGNIHLAGYFQGIVDFDPGASYEPLTGDNDYDVFILKLDSSGDYLWAKSMSGPEAEECKGLTVDGQGNVYATGGFNGIVDFDPDPSVFELSASSLYEDIFIVKLNNEGHFIWARAIGATGIDVGAAITVRGANLYVTGIFMDTVDFDPNEGVQNFNSIDAGDFYLLKLQQNHEMLFVNENINTDNSIMIYPNPSTGIFKIDRQGSPNSFDVTICNGTGQVIFRKEVNNSILEVNLSGFPAGNYFARIQDGSTNVTQAITLIK